MTGAVPSSSQPAASREPGGSPQATPSYGSGLAGGPQMAGSPRVGKPGGHPPWSDPTMSVPGQPGGAVPVSAGALQQVRWTTHQAIACIPCAPELTNTLSSSGFPATHKSTCMHLRYALMFDVRCALVFCWLEGQQGQQSALAF